MGGRVLDSSGYSKPAPLVGVYIAAASLLCGLAMAFDAFSGLHLGRAWFPSSHFPLSATTVTLLSIASKLPTDLTTPMPRCIDQLAKLSGTTLLAVAAANFLPSVGSSRGFNYDAIAVAITFLTVTGNVVTQNATGVIYTFRIEHALLLAAMLALLLLLLSSALAMDAANMDFEDQYNAKHDDASLDREDFTIDKLKNCINKYWLMTHSAGPQHVIGRSPTCAPGGALCLLSVAGINGHK